MENLQRVLIGNYTDEERQRIDHLMIAAVALAGRTDVDSGLLTRTADRLLNEYTKTGVPIARTK